MTRTEDPLRELLDATSRSELRARLNASRPALSLPQAQRLLQRLEALREPVVPLRVGVVHTYTSELLDPWLQFESAVQGLALETHHAPYGVTLQEAQPGSRLVEHKPDLLLLLLCWDDLHPTLRRPLSALDSEGRATLSDTITDSVAQMLARFRANISGQIVLTLLPQLFRPGLGEYDSLSDASESAWRADVKRKLAARMRNGLANCILMDLDESLLELGRGKFFDERLWYSARFPFTSQAAREFARRVAAVAAAIKLPRAKAIVLDADNTLWGGIIGEDGMTGIALGPDYPGNAYVAFQRRLLDFHQRGFILVLCSKNNPGDVMEVLRNHPHQVLREEHFAAVRINWARKLTNLHSLAAELNLGFESFVFVDDSAHECWEVRSELPQVEVIQAPIRPLEVVQCLDHVARLEVLALTDEDRRKTGMYVQERQRKEFAAGSTDPGQYLASLKMRMLVGLNDRLALTRLAQLTQKTNQFNLTTRRYTEADVQQFIDSSAWLVAHFSLSDIFGDAGIVGLALIQLEETVARLDTFLMSCRVIGRKAEVAFLDTLLRHLAATGTRYVLGEFLPTAKNELVKDFLAEQGFRQQTDGRWLRDLRETPPADAGRHPIEIDLTPLR